MFIIASEWGFFVRVGSFQGQPMAMGATTIDDAKKFKTAAAAQAVIDKHTGTGCGMERFNTIKELPSRKKANA